MTYDARNKSKHDMADCQAAVGKLATLPLTGKIVDAGESSSGAYVKFEVDPRWGFTPGYRYVMDLDCFEVGS